VKAGDDVTYNTAGCYHAREGNKTPNANLRDIQRREELTDVAANPQKIERQDKRVRFRRETQIGKESLVRSRRKLG
jgi:hypothetical protein